jgi:hypothetical protein
MSNETTHLTHYTVLINGDTDEEAEYIRDYMRQDDTCQNGRMYTLLNNVNDGFNMNSAGYNEWSKHDEDMKKVSLLFPGRLFLLMCSSDPVDESPWVKYYMDGKVQKAEALVRYAAFDVNKLE